MESTYTPEPWERQLKESDVAFEAFVVYRDMAGKRSVTAVAKQLSKSRHLISRWKQTHHWEERVTAWDNEQDRLTREALTQGITNMRKKHVAMAEALLGKAARALQFLSEQEMTIQDVTRVLDVAVRIERLSRGEVTDRTDNRSEVNGNIIVATNPYAELTVEELRKLARLADGDGVND